METVYIETTIVSYLVAYPDRDSIVAAHQKLTRQWWQEERLRYECVTSSEVLREAGLGDAEMSRRRVEALAGLAVLAVNELAQGLARELLAAKILPPSAASDAIHAVVASQRRVNILLTWPTLGQSPFTRKIEGIHGRAWAAPAGGLHAD